MRGFSTRAIRAVSHGPRIEQVPTAVPIYQSATFGTADAGELAEVLGEGRPGFAYSRIDNPTTAAAAAAVAELEGAEAGFAFASGMAAIHAAIVALASAGDRIVTTKSMYGSTQHLFTNVLGRLGIGFTFVDITDHQAVEAALAAAPTRLLYAETVSNPTIVVADIGALAEIAHRHGALLVVDNTFASPWVCRPIELGADLVVASGTKWLGGHTDVTAGFVVGRSDLVGRARAIQTDTGATLGPLDAFLVMRGIATLAVRMERHAASARALAGWLERQAGVARVYYPGLPTHPQATVAARQLHTGGAMLAFELTAGRPAGAAFIDALTIPERTASLGSVHTFVVHPASTTQRQLSEAELREAGISPGLLRVSVGLEDVEDLVADFEQALEVARGRAEPVAVSTA